MIHKFLGHSLLISEIIGVGPLMTQSSSDSTTAQLYNPKRLYFMVYTKSNTIRIESDWINFYGPESEKETRKETWNTLIGRYNKAISEIETLLTTEKK